MLIRDLTQEKCTQSKQEEKRLQSYNIEDQEGPLHIFFLPANVFLQLNINRSNRT